MAMDPIMRCSWLFYVVFPWNNQLNAGTSFLVALGEVFRRFMWNFFHMENEHMTNVRRFTASRNVPLPFALSEFQSDSNSTTEAQSSMLDYGRVDIGRPVRIPDHAGYDC
jgi:xenotropic and polytropic retrovirus receptor 1